MSKPENTFITSVHAHLPPISQLYRMKNNNMFNAGIADCWYSGPKNDLWIEWKFIVVPKRNDTPIDLLSGKTPMVSTLQFEWLNARENEGRNVMLGIGSKDGGVLLSLVHMRANLMNTAFFKMKMRTRKELADSITKITGVLPT